ncbi:hypothetical protein BD626DRAFT_472458 [Schizophyllum amplum]|uniref:Uncharacterized protein n=1 Tax=Schizophyllum amplum TaxID=97359 RepID=A0A550CVX4_9AGAR|nr:hypothetical protein BD626DRAFT_472458 [Auriculariopsis ampla]
MQVSSANPTVEGTSGTHIWPPAQEATLTLPLGNDAGLQNLLDFSRLAEEPLEQEDEIVAPVVSSSNSTARLGNDQAPTPTTVPSSHTPTALVRVSDLAAMTNTLEQMNNTLRRLAASEAHSAGVRTEQLENSPTRSTEVNDYSVAGDYAAPRAPDPSEVATSTTSNPYQQDQQTASPAIPSARQDSSGISQGAATSSDVNTELESDILTRVFFEVCDATDKPYPGQQLVVRVGTDDKSNDSFDTAMAKIIQMLAAYGHELTHLRLDIRQPTVHGGFRHGQDAMICVLLSILGHLQYFCSVHVAIEKDVNVDALGLDAFCNSFIALSHLRMEGLVCTTRFLAFPLSALRELDLKMSVSAQGLFQILERAPDLELLVIQTPWRSSRAGNPGRTLACPAWLIADVKYPTAIHIDSDQSAVWAFLSVITSPVVTIRLTTKLAACPHAIRKIFEERSTWSLQDRIQDVTRM